MNKAELRAQLRHVRLELTDAQHTVKSREITARLVSEIDWSAVKTVHCFEPIKNLLEPDISGLVTYLEDTYPAIEIFVPRQIEGEWDMVSIRDAPPPAEFDVVIVPMLGFDSALQRIGYGGGYYDKFLATQPSARKIGVCFSLGKIDKVPAEKHDIPLDLIITEQGAFGK
jgi:5-formyltetrahydrofolate cyclo-ligase